MSLAGIRGKPRINDTAPKNRVGFLNNQWDKKKIMEWIHIFRHDFESVKLQRHMMYYVNKQFS